jgi:WD40 repeat protein
MRCRVLALLLLPAFVPTIRAADPTYWQDVRPVLRKNCTACHSAKNVAELDVSGGLAMDSYEAVVKNPKKPMLHAGKSGESLMIKVVISTDSEKRMPLGARPLPVDAIALLRRWIDTGAKEGQRDNGAETTVTTPTPPRVRKLDVFLTTTTTPAQGALGAAKPAALKLALKVGPLAPVPAVVFSNDGNLLATGAYGRVTIWDLTRGEPVKVLTNVLGAVNDLRFSPDGKLLAVSGGQPSAKGDIRLYQVADWKLVATLPGHDDVVASIAFSPDGKHLASASFDKTVRLWDLATHKQERIYPGHSDFVYAVAFSPDGQWLFSASKDRSVKLVEVATGKSKLTFSDRNDEVIALAVHPSGQWVVLSGAEPGLSWFDTKTGERTRSQAGHRIGVHELCFSKDGKLLASAGGDGTVKLWDGSTGAVTQTLTTGSMVYAVALSPDGKRVAAGCFDGLVRLYDTATAKPLLTLLSLPPQGEASDWLALTPEGYAAGSTGLLGAARWQMGTQDVSAATVWKGLNKPELIGRAIKGETLPAPTFAP